MESLEAKLKELEAVLVRFPLSQMAEHVLPELDTRWEWALRVLQRSKLKIRVATLVPVLMERLRRDGCDEDRVQRHINTLSLKRTAAARIKQVMNSAFNASPNISRPIASRRGLQSNVALSESREWFAHALLERTSHDEPIGSAVAHAPERVETALRHAYRNTQCTVEVHSVKMSSWLFMSVVVRSERLARRPLYVAALSAASYVFTSQRALPRRVGGALAAGMGWARAESAELSGRHLESLLRVLQQDMNASARALLPPPEYEPRALRLPHGVDCTADAYNMHYAGELIGSEPPLLRRLETSSARPHCDVPGAPRVRVTLAVDGEDVGGALRDLVRVKAIAANSQWLSAFRSTKTNRIELDGDADSMEE